MSKKCVVSKNNAKSNDDQWLLKIYHHGTLMMVQFVLKRGNTFENEIISREIHFRRMILSFLMMMTSGFSGITGNWLDLKWWLHCFLYMYFSRDWSANELALWIRKFIEIAITRKFRKSQTPKWSLCRRILLRKLQEINTEILTPSFTLK